MDVLVRSYTVCTVDVGVYRRFSKISIYVSEQLFSKGHFTEKKSKKNFTNIGID